MNAIRKNIDPRVGAWVQVRSRAEILATLDARGELDGLPFMPEMLEFCGQRFRIWKRAHKTCDTVNKTGGRRMNATVHLQELRCDGAAHGGCQAGCLLYWKEAWLAPVDSGSAASLTIAENTNEASSGAAPRCSEQNLYSRTVVEAAAPDADPTYVCQTTRLPYVSTPLAWWDLRQYWEDYFSGNVGLGRMFSSFLYRGYLRLSDAGIGVGRPMRWIYNKFQKLRGGVPFPTRKGLIPMGRPTPVIPLDLQPGELVRVKSYDEILATLDTSNKNRGLYFDCEEVPYCGRTYRVKNRVSRIINERTGKMSHFKTESVILDGVYCEARYSDRRLFCPRSIYPMWREAWLERVATDDAAQPATTNGRVQKIHFAGD